MANAFIVRRGGSGGLKSTDAILRVIAEAGSTVTISKGTVSKSDVGHENADDNTLYDYYFIIHASQFDSITPWTVTAVNGSKTATATIIIDSSDEYDLPLYFGRLYWLGDECTSVSGGWTQYNVNGGTTGTAHGDLVVTKYADNMYIQGSASASKFGAYGIVNQIDLTNFSALNITFSEVGPSTYKPTIRILSGNSGVIGDIQVASLDLYEAGVGTRSLDVSALNGNYYIALTGGQGNNSNRSYLRFSKLWLS